MDLLAAIERCQLFEDETVGIDIYKENTTADELMFIDCYHGANYVYEMAQNKAFEGVSKHIVAQRYANAFTRAHKQLLGITRTV